MLMPESTDSIWQLPFKLSGDMDFDKISVTGLVVGRYEPLYSVLRSPKGAPDSAHEIIQKAKEMAEIPLVWHTKKTRLVG